MPNPNTVAAKLLTERDNWLRLYNDLRLSKATREAALRAARSIEDELDLPADERTPAHNGRPAGKAPALAAPYGSQRAVQPLEPLTLTIHELQVARNELKTLTLADAGCIIHGLRRILQHDTGETQEGARALLNRILRTVEARP